MKEVDVLKLWDRFDQSDASELTYSQGDVSFTLKRTVVAAPMISATSNVGTGNASAIQSENYIKSPMVGTYYRASAPDEEPFVVVGQTVKKGDVVGIVESMKMMNEIVSDRDGVVESIEVSDGDLVEFEQPLIRMK